MNVRKIIQKRIRRDDGGVHIVGDVNATIAANVNEPGGHTHVSTRTRVEQRSGEASERRRSARPDGQAKNEGGGL